MIIIVDSLFASCKKKQHHQQTISNAKNDNNNINNNNLTANSAQRYYHGFLSTNNVTGNFINVECAVKMFTKNFHLSKKNL